MAIMLKAFFIEILSKKSKHFIVAFIYKPQNFIKTFVTKFRSHFIRKTSNDYKGEKRVCHPRGPQC